MNTGAGMNSLALPSPAPPPSPPVLILHWVAHVGIEDVCTVQGDGILNKARQLLRARGAQAQAAGGEDLTSPVWDLTLAREPGQEHLLQLLHGLLGGGGETRG